MAGYDFDKKSINEYEIWLQGSLDTWSQYYIWEYNDGSASKTLLRGPFSEQEYFKLILQGVA